MPHIEWIDQTNKAALRRELYQFLLGEYHQDKSNGLMFLNHWDKIDRHFDEHAVMLMVSTEAIGQRILGFMSWSLYDGGAKIEFVQVAQKHRRKGFFKELLAAFSAKYTSRTVLSVSPIPESVDVFRNLGWRQTTDIHNRSHFFYLLKPVLDPSNTLPAGHAIAVFSKADAPDNPEHIDFYTVRANPTRYPIKYYPITLNHVYQDEKAKLDGSIIVAPFDDEGYIAVYFNQRLVAEGNPKDLFKNSVCGNGLLVLERLEPKEPEKFHQYGFFKIKKYEPTTLTAHQPTVLLLSQTTSDSDLQSEEAMAATATPPSRRTRQEGWLRYPSHRRPRENDEPDARYTHPSTRQ